MGRAAKAKAAPVVGTWNPVAVYGAAGRLSDADLLRWVLEREARVFAHQALRARDPVPLHGPRAKPNLAEAEVQQVLADRLAAIASRVECFASTTTPIADGLRA